MVKSRNNFIEIGKNLLAILWKEVLIILVGERIGNYIK